MKTTLALIFSLFLSNIIYSQCTNPDPTATTTTVSFCAVDDNRVSDLQAATGTTGGDIVWFDVPTGGTQLDNFAVLDTGTYYADDVASGNCSSNRLEITVTVNGNVPENVNISITECESDNPTIINLSATPTGTGVIEWFDSQTGGTLLTSDTPLTDGSIYWVQQTENGCTSERLPTEVTFVNVTNPTLDVADQIQEFCTTDNPTIADLVANANDLTWYPTMTSEISFPSNAPLTNGESYWVSNTSPLGCESVQRVEVQVVIEDAPNAGANATYEECELFLNQNTVNLFDSLGGSPNTGGTWSGPSTLSNGDLGTFDNTIHSAGTYTYTVTSGTGICSNASATVTVTVNSTSAPTTAATTQEFCAIDTPTIANLQVTGNNIMWYAEVTSTTALSTTDALIDGEDYWATQTVAGCESAIRLEVTVTLNTTAAPTTTATTQEFCAIDTPTIAALQATGNNIMWYADATSTTPLNTTDALIDGQQYWATQTDATTGCVSSNRLTVTVILNTTVAPTTTATTQEFCATDAPTVADIQVTGNNVIWYISETSTTALSTTDALIDGQNYWATQTDATTGCVSSTRLMVTVTLNTTAAPTTTAATQDFCAIDSPTIADIQVTGNNIIWYISQTSTTPLSSTDALIDGQQYWGTQTDATTGCVSSDRLMVTVTLNTTALPVSLAVQQFCPESNPTVSDLQAIGNDINWYISETSTTALAVTEALIDGQEYWATQTDATTGCVSGRVMVTANFTVVSPPTGNPTQEFCAIDTPTVADLVATGNNIMWYANATSTDVLSTTDALIDGEDYWATQTDVTTNCVSPTRLMVNVTLNTTAAPTTTATTQEFCATDAPTIADIQVTGNNVIWYISETSTTALSSTDALIDGQNYWATQTDATTGCVSSTRLMVTVNLNITAAPTTTAATQDFCAVDSPTIADIQATGTNIMWYADATSTTALSTTDALIDGEDYWATQTVAGCVSSDRLMVTVTLNTTAAPTTTDATQEFCPENNPTIANLQVTGTNIMWYADATSTTPLSSTDALIDGQDYWATQTDATTGCVSSDRLMITVTLTAISAPTTTDPTQEFCAIDSPTVADIQVTGTNITWYISQTSTTPLSSTDVLIGGQDYWATQTDGTGCVSSDRLMVNVTLNTTAAPTTTATTQEFCATDAPTIADIQVTGNNVIWYISETSTTALNTTDSLIDAQNYWATQTDATTGCVSSTRLMVTVNLNITAAPTTTAATQDFCAVDSPTIADIQVTGTNIMWYADATSTTALSSTDALIDGEDYWATQTVAGCVSSDRLMVTVTLNTTAAPTTTDATQEFCATDTTPTIADIQVTGNNIVWYISQTSTTPLNSTDALIDGQQYWATQTIVGCVSSDRLMVTVTINTTAAPTTTDTTQEFCVIDSPTIADIQVTGTNIMWYADATSTTALNATDALIDGEDYWASQTVTGCESSRLLINVLLVTVDEPTFAVADGDQFCSVNNPTLEDLNNNIQIDSNNTYFWYDSYPSGTPLSLGQLLEANTTYYLVSVNSLGCASEPLIVNPNLDACDGENIVLYDGFSPTGDGINDTFHIENINVLYPNYNIIFYNRWGNVVYEGNALKPEWNGKLYGTGKYLPVGVYYYIIYFNKGNKKPIQNRLYLSR